MLIFYITFYQTNKGKIFIYLFIEIIKKKKKKVHIALYFK